MAQEKTDFDQLREGITLLIHDRIFLMGKDDPVFSGLFALLRSGTHHAEAVKRVEAGFRATLRSAVGGPFDQLASDLIETTLDLVDWGAIVAAIRQREE